VGKLGWKHTPILDTINNSPFKKDIKLLGYVDRAELPAFEGFGLPVLEAMSCGVPTIVSNVSSLPEIIGEAGLLFPPNNQAILIQKIKQLLADKSVCQSLAEKGLAQSAKFSWEKTARETLAVFEALMA